MAEAVNSHGEAAGQPPKSPDEVAMGFIKVANETMCRPIRALTQMRVRLHPSCCQCFVLNSIKQINLVRSN